MSVILKRPYLVSKSADWEWDFKQFSFRRQVGDWNISQHASVESILGKLGKNMPYLLDLFFPTYCKEYIQFLFQFSYPSVWEGRCSRKRVICVFFVDKNLSGYLSSFLRVSKSKQWPQTEWQKKGLWRHTRIVQNHGNKDWRSCMCLNKNSQVKLLFHLCRGSHKDQRVFNKNKTALTVLHRATTMTSKWDRNTAALFRKRVNIA